MASRSYHVNLILRTILIAATIYLFFFLLLNTHYPFTTAMTGVLSLVQCWLLILSIDKVNRIWTHFFEAVKNAEFTQNYSLPAGKSFRALKTEYAMVMDIFRKYSLDKERQYQYLRTITQNIGVGILVFDQRGDIDFSNEAFYGMLGTHAFRNIAEIEDIDRDFSRTLKELKNGESELLRFNAGDDWLQLIVSVTDFILLQEKYRLVSIQNIRRELEENEIDAWQKLARVLTHEIMNSITPISSLASTANGILARLSDGNPHAQEGARDVADALESIERRSRSLLSFTENYRKFLGIPKPVLGKIHCRDLFSRVKTLMSGVLEEKKIDFRYTTEPENIELTADKDLLEQVLINLIKNSIEASGKTKKPAIDASAYLGNHNKPVIEIADNGQGIAEDLLDKIFIPFFTTKSGGSGIGLSLSRQIMRLHNGTISVTSIPGKRTVFALRF